MKYQLIVAMCETRGIGYKNNLPWKIPEDLKYFSKLTKGNGNNAIVMGKNTWYSLNCKPLPKRDNLILSSSLIKKTDDNYEIFNNINSLNEYCESKQYDEVWIIGGMSVYKQFLQTNLLNKCYVTYIKKHFICDTFFPKLSLEWKLSEVDIFNNIDNEELFVLKQIFTCSRD